MQKFFKISQLLILILGLSLFSCIDENENLVNPPSNIETVNIRFINLGGDFESRNLTFNGTSSLENINFASSSKSEHPPADSAFLSVRKSGLSEFSLKQIVKFSRNIFYSYFALPSPDGDSAYHQVDTLIAITSSLAMPSYSVDAYIKLFNAFPDSTVTFSLVIGCPNSLPLISNIRYREVSLPSFIRAGKVPISILKNSTGGSQLVGTFALNLVSKGQYSMIVSREKSGNPGVYFLDDKNLSSSALSPAERIDEKYTDIRLINLSSENITAINEQGDVIAQDQQVNYVGKYNQISACKSNSKDSVIILSGNNHLNSFTTSFEVLEKYSIIIADSAESKGRSYVLVPPSRETNFDGKALIRVVNLASNLPTLDLSVASRMNVKSDLGYSSGTSLAKALKFANISSNVLIEPGELPLTMFTTYSPVEMLYSSITRIEANKEYLIVITSLNNKYSINLIENTEENKQLNPIEESSFIQIINSVSRSNFAKININNNFSNAKIYFANSLATNLPKDEVNIDFQINDKLKNVKFTPKLDSRYTLVLTGDKDEPDYVLIENKITSINRIFADKRFINASTDFPSIWVVDNISKDTVPSAELMYKDYTPYNSLDKSKKYTFYFFNPSTKKSILNYSIDVTLGKRYSLIFTGTNKDKFGYSIIQVQEY